MTFEILLTPPERGAAAPAVAALTPVLPTSGDVPDEDDAEFEAMSNAYSEGVNELYNVTSPFDFLRDLFCPTAFPTIGRAPDPHRKPSKPLIPNRKLKHQNMCAICDPKGIACECEDRFLLRLVPQISDPLSTVPTPDMDLVDFELGQLVRPCFSC